MSASPCIILTEYDEITDTIISWKDTDMRICIGKIRIQQFPRRIRIRVSVFEDTDTLIWQFSRKHDTVDTFYYFLINK